jgi:hypothetical protein
MIKVACSLLESMRIGLMSLQRFFVVKEVSFLLNI